MNSRRAVSRTSRHTSRRTRGGHGGQIGPDPNNRRHRATAGNSNQAGERVGTHYGSRRDRSHHRSNTGQG